MTNAGIPANTDRETHTAPLTHAEDPTVPERVGGWLWVIYPVAQAALGLVWGAVLSVLLAKQIALTITDPSASAGALGLVIAAGAVVAMIATPILGRLSDRTPGRFLGRRNIWILGGSILGAAGLLFTATVENPTVLAIVWPIAILPLSGLSAALIAVLPERVPVRNRGGMSGLVGSASIVGTTAGIVVGGLTTSVFVGYLVVAIILLVVSTIFALSTRDYKPAPGSESGTVDTTIVDPVTGAVSVVTSPIQTLRQSPNFWWAFAGRFMMILGYYLTTGFGLYVLRDFIKVGDTQAAGEVYAGVQSFSLIFVLISAIGGGIIADKLDRTRLFVIISSALFVPAALILLFFPTLPGVFVANALFGFAFGAYLAVDQSLMSRVLPSKQNSARDLGILNIANSGAQIAGPALAGAIIAATGQYPILFILTAVLAAGGALVTRFIRGIR